MEYLHMNYPIPKNATGVPVTIEVIDSNNNRYEIGTVTSDLTGSFGLPWKPIISGTYKVFAIFKGSNSYGSSQATTYFTADDAVNPTETTQPEPPQSLMTDTYLIGIGVAIIIAIAVVGTLMLMAIRKRP
jgi:hypothetical protein